MYLPTDKKYYINWGYYYFENVHSENKYWKYNQYLNNNCQFNIFYYSKDEEKFACEPNESDLKSAKIEYLKYELAERFDEISTIKHVNKYKREYYDDWFEDFDWKVDSINWLNDNTLELTISDKTITLTSKISIKENENNVEVLSQELKKLDYTRDDYDENDKKFEQKYYNNTEFLSWALINLE